MTSQGLVPGGESLRPQIAATRRRLHGDLQRVSALAAPARLAATGAEAVRSAITHKALDTLHHVAAVASTTSRKPGVMSMAATGAVSAVLLLLRRRRGRRSRARAAAMVPRRVRPHPGMRARSSWLGLALSIAALLLRRRL